MLVSAGWGGWVEIRGLVEKHGFGSEVLIQPDDTNGLERASAAQCQHVRAVSIGRVDQIRGNVAAVVLTQIRDVIGLVLDIPT